jgi:hypothetical protein
MITSTEEIDARPSAGARRGCLVAACQLRGTAQCRNGGALVLVPMRNPQGQ